MKHWYSDNQAQQHPLLFEKKLWKHCWLNCTIHSIQLQEKPHDSAVATLEQQLTWIDSQLASYLGQLQAVGTMPQRKKMRRLLTAANCTLMSDTTNELQSISMCDVSVIAARAEPSAETKNFVKSVVEVRRSQRSANCHCVISRSGVCKKYRLKSSVICVLAWVR